MSGPDSASLESADSAPPQAPRFAPAGAALKAPAADRTALIAPPLDQAGPLMAAGAKLRRESNYDVQGRSLAALAAEARCELIGAARRYTASYRNVPAAANCEQILLAGHQPQLFHPGVWFKNFALAKLARQHQAAAVNLVIDSDTLKEASLRVPGGALDDPIRTVVPFDEPSEEIPFEQRLIRDRALFADFGRRAQEAMAAVVPNPLLGEFWPRVVARSRETNNLGECLSQSRHQLEGDWGLETLELPQRQVCRLGAFQWFVAHLLAQLPRFREIHNRALGEYRRRYHLRSANHPVPDLAAEGDWLEAPFWLWTADRPQRRHMFIRRSGDEFVVSDRGQIEFRLPLKPDGDASRAAAVLAELPARGICLRTRALTTTMFARLFLGDLFLHGIGGGLYDQLTDAIVERFFGFAPPPFMVLSATLLLPIERTASAAESLREANRRAREIEYHPERFIAPSLEAQPELVDALATKRRWVATPQTPANARERCRAIRAANETLARALASERRQAQADRERSSRRLRAESVFAWREYAFCLYPKRTLQDFLLAFLNAKP